MTAYLLLFLDITKTPPEPLTAGTFSSDAASITMSHRNRAAVEVTRLDLGSYAESSDALERLVADTPFYTWLRPFMGRVPQSPTVSETSKAVEELRANGEHVIFLLFSATLNAALPICWCHTEAEAHETRRRLLDDAKASGRKPPLIWHVPVSDVPRLP